MGGASSSSKYESKTSDTSSTKVPSATEVPSPKEVPSPTEVPSPNKPFWSSFNPFYKDQVSPPQTSQVGGKNKTPKNHSKKKNHRKTPKKPKKC